jgi:hypothetical protein
VWVAPVGFCAAALSIVACSPSGGPERVEERHSAITAVYAGSVLPSDTDGVPGSDSLLCAIPQAKQIGCPMWTDDIVGDVENKNPLANDKPHYFYYPSSSTDDSILLLLVGGGSGTAPPADDGFSDIYEVAAKQGYHVIGLTYPAGDTNSCGWDVLPDEHLSAADKRKCYGDMLTKTITGQCPDTEPTPGCSRTTVDLHPQDSLENRLVKALQWAAGNIAGGWDRYLTAGGDPDWSKIRVMGHSGGASHAAQIGLIHKAISRVALLSSPNDGTGADEPDWKPADYLQATNGTKRHYFGLVHWLNHYDLDPNALFKTTDDWLALGMGQPANPPERWFDPEVPADAGVPPVFGGAHMLVSDDFWTTACEAHNSVLSNRYRFHSGDGCDSHCNPEPVLRPFKTPGCDPTVPFDGAPIGYEPAWRCLLGSGDPKSGNRDPIVYAGPDRTVECQALRGAAVTLDGGSAYDLDCDLLDVVWTWPSGQAPASPSPSAFLWLGPNTITLTASDWPNNSAVDQMQITVRDTLPPNLQVKVTPTVLSPPDHRLVRIDATVSATDACDVAAPKIQLASITSSDPDSGTGAGDVPGDVVAGLGGAGAVFYLRAERSTVFGRTYRIKYTATDTSANQAAATVTVSVPSALIPPTTTTALP